MWSRCVASCRAVMSRDGLSASGVEASVGVVSRLVDGFGMEVFRFGLSMSSDECR